mgnify:CR=1 FL=1
MHSKLDIHQEDLISLKEASSLLPKRNGKRTHYSTLFRWATKGAKGRVLESVMIGGVRFTSKEALGRFSSSTNRNDTDTSRIIAQFLSDEGV